MCHSPGVIIEMTSVLLRPLSFAPSATSRLRKSGHTLSLRHLHANSTHNENWLVNDDDPQEALDASSIWRSETSATCSSNRLWWRRNRRSVSVFCGDTFMSRNWHSTPHFWVPDHVLTKYQNCTFIRRSVETTSQRDSNEQTHNQSDLGLSLEKSKQILSQAASPGRRESKHHKQHQMSHELRSRAQAYYCIAQTHDEDSTEITI